MAKSIRSKIKRKHRAEFRRTIGEKAYQDSMSKIQNKLKQTIDKGSSSAIPSLTKLSNLFQTENDNNNNNNDRLQEDPLTNEPNDEDENSNSMAIDALETTAAAATVITTTNITTTTTTSNSLNMGVNKAPVRKSRRKGKHALSPKPPKAIKERRKPKFFCEFK